MKRLNKITQKFEKLQKIQDAAGVIGGIAYDEVYIEGVVLEGKLSPTDSFTALKDLDLSEAVWAPLWKDEEHGDVIVFESEASAMELLDDAIAEAKEMAKEEA